MEGSVAVGVAYKNLMYKSGPFLEPGSDSVSDLDLSAQSLVVLTGLLERVSSFASPIGTNAFYISPASESFLGAQSKREGRREGSLLLPLTVKSAIKSSLLVKG